MSTSKITNPPPFTQDQAISQTMINNPTFNMFNHVNNVNNMVTNADSFNRLFKYICVNAFAESGLYDHMKCHPGTREVILERLEHWVAAPGNADRLITWLDGPMGSGKTSVAVTMADRASTKNKLIGSFVFRRGQPGRNEDSQFVATLAYQMALSIPLVRPFIEEQISHDQSVLHQSLSRQLDALILNPLHKMRSQNPDIDVATLPNLIIVDGLDECGPDKEDSEGDGMGEERGKKEQQLGVLELLHRLALSQDVLPFAILVHSRPEMHIKHWFNMDPHASITHRFTLDSSYNPSDDIRLFVTHSLLNLLETHPLCLHLRITKWPYEVLITDIWGQQVLVNAIDLIVKRSEGLFVYASIVINFISSKSHPPSERLLQILERDRVFNNSRNFPYTTLDALYTQILDSVSNPKDGRRILFLNSFVSCMGKANVPLGLSNLLSLLSISEPDFNYFLQQTASILTLGTEPFLTFQHSSLEEFLMNSERSQHWCVHHYDFEIARDLALNAFNFFAIESSVATQLFYQDILWRVLSLVLRGSVHEPEDWRSTGLVKELKGFLDFQNSSYRTPVMRVLTSHSWGTFLSRCYHMFHLLEDPQYGRCYKRWIYRFGSHIRTLFMPYIKGYLKNPGSLAMLMGHVFGIPVIDTDYKEDIFQPIDCPFAFGKLHGPQWIEFLHAPTEWLLHVFSIQNLDFLCEAFTILLKHAGRHSVMFDWHREGPLQFISLLEDQILLSQELWLAILDCDEYFLPPFRSDLHHKVVLSF